MTHLTTLAQIAPTLADYTPLDAGILRIGTVYLVFCAGKVVNARCTSRLAAIDALYLEAKRLHDEEKRL